MVFAFLPRPGLRLQSFYIWPPHSCFDRFTPTHLAYWLCLFVVVVLLVVLGLELTTPHPGRQALKHLGHSVIPQLIAWDGVLLTFLTRLSSNIDLPDLCFLCNWDFRCEALHLAQIINFYILKQFFYRTTFYKEIYWIDFYIIK
jgi:hypothetical protein